MKNKGLFSTLYIDEVKKSVTLNDQAQGRFATLSQTWKTRNTDNQNALWDTFLKQAISYLEFVPPNGSSKPGIYPLYEDFSYSQCVSVLYLVEPGVDIDEISIGRFAPAKLVAELQRRKLNWGIVTDGSVWRLYSIKTSRPNEDFVELPLSKALEDNDEAEYGLFEFFFHRDSFVPVSDEENDKTSADEAAGVYKCRLDTNRDESEKILEELVKKPFLYQIDEVLQYLCNGFIQDTPRKGDEYTEEERSEIFQSSVKLLYRCLFLFYAESRRLLPSDPDKRSTYQSHSMAALCARARVFRWGMRDNNMGYDLWKHFQGLISAVNDGDPEYGIMGYDGGLFDDKEEKYLGEHRLRNDFLSRALYLMAYVEPLTGDQEDEYKIPYEDLEVRHLGELYENILEFTVQLADADRIRRRTRNGVETLLASQTQRKVGDSYINKGDVYFGESALERKQTGSYYTPESLVKFLNKKTIVEPLSGKFEEVHRKRFNELLKQAEEADDSGFRRGAIQGATALVENFVKDEVLRFKVCDPAMGSGHFLIDAANQMTGLILSQLEEIPFIDGVETEITSDPNSWRRQITRHCLYGVDLNPLAVHLSRLSLWLNSFASDHKLTFLDHHLKCGNSLIGIRSIQQLADIPKRKKDSRRDADKYRDLFPNYGAFSSLMNKLAEKANTISLLDEDETDEQKALLDEIGSETTLISIMGDLYTSYIMDSNIDTTEYYIQFKKLADDGIDTNEILEKQRILKLAAKYKTYHHFFHWPLEFPDVFGSDKIGGFSATVGNPPWDIVKPNSQEFFSDYDPKFRSYKKPEANRISKKLMADNPAIAEKWQEYCEGIAEQSAYFKEPTCFKALGKGDINTFKLFLERFFTSLREDGHMGIIVPSSIYTDQGCQSLREIFFNHSRIKFLYCFENRRAIFNIHRSFKFVLFGIRKGGETERFNCAFMEHNTERLSLIEANALRMTLAHIKQFSPQSMSFMEFKDQKEIDICSKIYKIFPLLGEVRNNVWNVKFYREIDINLDHKFVKEEPSDYVIYEGKMIWLFDHAFQKPQYWISRTAAENKFSDFQKKQLIFENSRVGFRGVASSTNERTLISSIVPSNVIGESMLPLAQIDRIDSAQIHLFICAMLNSFVLDFTLRLKVSMRINNFYIYQLPLPRLDEKDNYFHNIVERSARLICTADPYSALWRNSFDNKWLQSVNSNPVCKMSINNYGPAHEQEVRRRLRDETKYLTPEWGPHCGVHDRLSDRRDNGDRAQLRAEIDAYVAHLYGLSRDDFAYILDTFPVLKKKEKKAFGEFMSKRKCLEEYDRIGKILSNK